MTELMGVRTNVLVGIPLHNLFGLIPRQSGNPYCLDELDLDKLHRKWMSKYLCVILAMGVLLIDECDQLSSPNLSILDNILRMVAIQIFPLSVPWYLILWTMSKSKGSNCGLSFYHLISSLTLISSKWVTQYMHTEIHCFIIYRKLYLWVQEIY